MCNINKQLLKMESLIDDLVYAKSNTTITHYKTQICVFFNMHIQDYTSNVNLFHELDVIIAYARCIMNECDDSETYNICVRILNIANKIQVSIIDHKFL